MHLFRDKKKKKLTNCTLLMNIAFVKSDSRLHVRQTTRRDFTT